MRSAALTLALLIVLSGAAPATALVPTGVDGGQASASAVAVSDGDEVAQVDEDDPPPATEIRIQLEADTDARWTITYRYLLADENEVEAFRDLGSSYEAGRADVGVDPSVFRTIARQVSSETGREMRIRDIERSATVVRNTTTSATATTEANTSGTATANATGTLSLSFTWTNFLEETDSGDLRLGDAFMTGSGETWLTSLGTEQRLTIGTPPGFVISRTSFPIQQQNGSLIIDGPREFTRNERLSVTYQESARADIPWTLLGGGVLVVVLLVAGLVFTRRRTASESGTATADQAVTNGGDSGTEAATGTTEPPRPGPGEAGEAETEADAEEEPDFELLSDEERVEYLLEQHGGRMKQANIVKETGWSDAKVSQLLSAMAEEDRVEKLRLGRENLISLPDEDVVDDGDGN